jgi:hypothetical protein
MDATPIPPPQSERDRMTEKFEEPPKVPQEVWDTMKRIMREAELRTGMSGADEPLVWAAKIGDLTEDGEIVWTNVGKPLGTDPKPTHYYPDGTPILDDALLPAFMKWGLLFEQRDDIRIVGQCKTLYGERLSTVWLGLDHNFSHIGPPMIYETMLFAPDPEHVRRRTIRTRFDEATGVLDIDREAKAEVDRFDAYIAKHYPHDQLQLRYSTRSEAEDSHEKLKLQCLIPPRWRHFLLGKIGGITTWLNYDDEGFEW